MIYLVVAKPRTGKSQWAVSKMYEHLAQGQAVFVSNFNQSDEQRQKMGVIKFDTPNDWWEKLPEGAVWFVDETQQIWGQRGKQHELPQHIKQLSLHGHRNLTIYLITQDAMQVDVHIRRNTNFTVYMTRPLGLHRANGYTFRDYQEIPNDAWRRSQTLKLAESKKVFRYKAKIQDSYLSASAHDHIKPRLPKRLLILPIGVAVVGYAVWSAYTGLTKTADDAPSPTGKLAAAANSAEAPAAAAPAASSWSSAAPVASSSPAYLARVTPRVKDMPWSAPAYDQFQVKDYPRLFCYVVEFECKCRTQQATPVPFDVSDAMCRDVAQNGYWDPFKEPIGQVAQAKQPGPSDPENGVSGSNGEFRIMDAPQGLPGGVMIPAESAPEPVLPVASPSGAPQARP